MDVQTLQTAARYMGFSLASEDAIVLQALVNSLPTGSISMMDVLYTIQHYTINVLLTYIEANKQLIGTNDFIFNQPALEEVNRKYTNFIEMSLYQSKPVKSDIPCINPTCRKQTVTYERIQIRSGDEGQSISFTCTSCGKNWISF